MANDKMTDDRAVFFLERFKNEEKMLGPNEQAALDHAITKLGGEPTPASRHAIKAATQPAAPASAPGQALADAIRALPLPEPAGFLAAHEHGGVVGCDAAFSELQMRDLLHDAASLVSAQQPAADVGAADGLKTCNCRWRGDELVQQCTLHEAHKDAIHEWAARAKEAEAKLPAAPHQPAQSNVMVNGLTEAETSATASVAGLTAQSDAGGDVAGLAERLREAYHSETKIGHPMWRNLDERAKAPWVAAALAALAGNGAGRVALTDEQIDAARKQAWGRDLDAFTAGAHFAERHHGIGTAAQAAEGDRQ